ncbi:regulatory signaling modulator protein AmpE [Alkalimarinus coralli]|uniref:regulatory signaling modulator protein AmpE n=1 Tax=Alkalimarinus coralli TaxID=2935863 RepID=UPI00202B83CC|nr:regulatory signaling modulator protein AmpE [Alkalimarinus coralli]
MSLVALLISYFLQQKLDLPLSVWFDRMTLQVLRPKQFSMMAKSSTAAFAVLMLILSAYFFFFYLLFFLIDDEFWNIPSLLLQIFVLLLLLGSNGFKEKLELYLRAWRKGDFESAGAMHMALSRANKRRLRSPVLMQNDVSSALLYHNFNRFFMVMFWFMVAGPAFAIVVRVANILAQHSSHKLKVMAVKVSWVAEWFPARLLALSFALMGDFKNTIRQCTLNFADFSTETATVLKRSASSALDGLNVRTEVHSGMGRDALIDNGSKGIEGVRGLLSRSMVLWLGLFAIAVITTV